MTNRRLVVIALALAFSVTSTGCCMGHGRSATSSETITLTGPGFEPDPTSSSGQAGGLMQASSLAATDANGNSCVGNLPPMPQHTVHLVAPLALLRVLVNGSDDTTLVVRTPTGLFYCNDDSGDPSNGLNASLDIPSAPAGDYSVYVGAFSDGAMLTTYSIGFTTTPGTFPSQVVR